MGPRMLDKNMPLLMSKPDDLNIRWCKRLYVNFNWRSYNCSESRRKNKFAFCWKDKDGRDNTAQGNIQLNAISCPHNSLWHLRSSLSRRLRALSTEMRLVIWMYNMLCLLVGNKTMYSCSFAIRSNGKKLAFEIVSKKQLSQCISSHVAEFI